MSKEWLGWLETACHAGVHREFAWCSVCVYSAVYSWFARLPMYVHSQASSLWCFEFYLMVHFPPAWLYALKSAFRKLWNILLSLISRLLLIVLDGTLLACFDLMHANKHSRCSQDCTNCTGKHTSSQLDNLQPSKLSRCFLVHCWVSFGVHPQLHLTTCFESTSLYAFNDTLQMQNSSPPTWQYTSMYAPECFIQILADLQAMGRTGCKADGG